MSAIDAWIALIFAAWFLLSIFAQLDLKWFDRFQRFDLLRLLPRWTFFAPNPGRTDYHILYRDRGANGVVSSWHELTEIHRRRPWSGLWNPEKREVKVVNDAVGSIMEAVNEGIVQGRSPKDVQLTLLIYPPYVLLVHYMLNKQPPLDSATHRQFVVVERFGFSSETPPRPLFLSPFHAW